MGERESHALALEVWEWKVRDDRALTEVLAALFRAQSALLVKVAARVG